MLKAASANVLQQNIFNFKFSFLLFPLYVLLFSFSGFLKCGLRRADKKKQKSLKNNHNKNSRPVSRRKALAGAGCQPLPHQRKGRYRPEDTQPSGICRTNRKTIYASIYAAIRLFIYHFNLTILAVPLWLCCDSWKTTANL